MLGYLQSFGKRASVIERRRIKSSNYSDAPDEVKATKSIEKILIIIKQKSALRSKTGLLNPLLFDVSKRQLRTFGKVRDSLQGPPPSIEKASVFRDISPDRASSRNKKVIDPHRTFLLHCATKAFHPTTTPQLDSGKCTTAFLATELALT